MKMRDLIPEAASKLLRIKAADFVEGHAEDIREIVTDILCGGNVRDLTESLTRKRLALANSSLVLTYLNACCSADGLPEDLVRLAARSLEQSDMTSEEKSYGQNIIGLTKKSADNILRGDSGAMEKYLDKFDSELRQAAEEAERTYGALEGEIRIKGKNMALSWPLLLRVFVAVGAQTLSIRGSEKSMYGKLFEKFILGSLLTILDFDHAAAGTSGVMIFWLSDAADKRESDATALLRPGTGVRFDIGFIGKGNPEISLDKVSRFGVVMEMGGVKHEMTTIIIVDSLGAGSKAPALAEEIGGEIVQMSRPTWVRDVAQALKDKRDYDHAILQMSDEDALRFVRQRAQEISLKSFL